MPPKKKATAAAAKKTAKPKATRATKAAKPKVEEVENENILNEEEVTQSSFEEKSSPIADEVPVEQPEIPEQSDNSEQPEDEALAEDVKSDEIEDPTDDKNESTDPVPENSNDKVDRDRYRIFITRLPYEATTDDVKSYFKQFGEVDDAYCPKQSDRPYLNKGFGFISFKSDEAIQAVFNAKPHSILGREIVVDRATIRSARNSERRNPEVQRGKRSFEGSDRDGPKYHRGPGGRRFERPNLHYQSGHHQPHSGGYGNAHPPYNHPPDYNNYDHSGYDRPGYSNYGRGGSGYGQSSGGYNQGYNSNFGGQYGRQSSYDRSYANPQQYDRQYEGSSYSRGFDPNRSVNYVFNAGEKDRRGENPDRRYNYDQNYQNYQYSAQQPAYSSTGPQTFSNSSYDNQLEPSRPSNQEVKRVKNKLFVGRMRNDTTVAAMKNYFERFGELIDAYIPKDPKTQKSRGFGFISFLNESSMRAVLQATYKHVIDGREVIVDMADRDQKKSR